MDAHQALKFLTSLCVEHVQSLGEARPATQEALILRAQEAHAVLLAAISPPEKASESE